MSARIDLSLPLESARPTRAGTRRRPRHRDRELRRPGQIYRAAIELSLANMIVMDRAREERSTTS